jgi:hypothetical protein
VVVEQEVLERQTMFQLIQHGSKPAGLQFQQQTYPVTVGGGGTGGAISPNQELMDSSIFQLLLQQVEEVEQLRGSNS